MIKLFKIHNELKLKLGMNASDSKQGQIDPKKIEEADDLIRKVCATSSLEIGRNLETLSAIWTKMKQMPASQERANHANKIYTVAHEIKDIGDLCGYKLVAFFGESLRDYIAQTSLNLKNQQIIIQAHIDAMNAAHKNNLREDGGPAAEELKRMVKVAIDKYR